MIPKTAFIAISLVMAASAAFGWAMHKVISEKKEDPEEVPDKHTCDNCKYYNVKPTEEPCFDCVTDDIDRWEGI